MNDGVSPSHSTEYYTTGPSGSMPCSSLFLVQNVQLFYENKMPENYSTYLRI